MFGYKDAAGRRELRKHLAAIHPRSGKPAFAVYQTGSHSIWVALPPEDVFWKKGRHADESPAPSLAELTTERAATAYPTHGDEPAPTAAACSPFDATDERHTAADPGNSGLGASTPAGARPSSPEPVPGSAQEETPGVDSRLESRSEWHRADHGDSD